MNHRLYLLFLFICYGLTACSQPATSAPEADEITPAAYLNTFFDYISTKALGRDTIDWTAFRQEVEQQCAGAKVPADTHDALHNALRRINKHSFLMRPEQARQYMPKEEVEDEKGGKEAAPEKIAPPEVLMTTGRRLNKNTAYLSIPSFGYQPAMLEFADSLQRLIASLDSPETSSWVLDLRTNTGGNCWPMLVGIGPLLGEGVCGYFIEPNGENGVPWSYEAGTSFMGSGPQLSLSEGREPYKLLHPRPSIAVLTGPRTMSSGEVVTVAFRGKANARSFGQPTGGYSTTNTNFNMPDGAVVVLTVSVYADRNKVVFGDRIRPDVEVEESKQEGEDPVLAKAMEWLEGER